MKKSLFIIVSQFLILFKLHSQSITINPSSQHIIDAQNSATNPAKGILIPRLTTNQRITTGGWVSGSMVYDTDTQNFWYYDGNIWQKIASGSNSLTLPYDGSVSQSGFAFSVTNTSNSSPWAISGIANFYTPEGIGVYGAAIGNNSVGVWGSGTIGVKGTGTPAGLFEGNLKIIQSNNDYPEAEMELLRGVGSSYNPPSPQRDTKLIMGKYTQNGYNNRWIFRAKVNGIQSQPTDRLKLQYSTNSAVAVTNTPVYSDYDVFTIKPTGEIGIGTDPTEKLDINGNLKLNGKINVNSSFGSDGQVLMSRGSSLPAEWKNVSSGLYNSLIIYNLSNDAYTGSINDLGGSFTLTTTSKVVLTLFGAFKKYSNCGFNCGSENLILKTCITSSQNGSCLTGQEVSYAQFFTEPVNLNNNVLLSGTAQKVFTLNAGTYYFRTDFSNTSSTGIGSNWQLSGNGENKAQLSVQIINN